MDPYAVTPLPRPPVVSVRVPGSKSHTNRALVAATLATGRSVVEGVLLADDTEAMLAAAAELGAEVQLDREARRVVVEGVAGRPRTAGRRLHARQSGTTGRFLLPVLTLGDGPAVLDGDEQLRRRPMGELTAALRHLGAGVEGDTLPLTVAGGGLPGGEVELDGSVSSQFLSGLLLAAPCATGPLTVRVPGPLVSTPYVTLTVEVMRAFGATVEVTDATFQVAPTGYRWADVAIEPDASAASYFFGAAAVSGGTVTVPGLGRHTVQGDLDFVRVLERMGATVEIGVDATTVTGPERLRGVTVDMAEISDTAQTLAVVATFADGPTEVTGIGFIRHKETDRVGAVVTELRRRGIEALETDDGFVVHPGVPSPGVVETYDDHRMAMSFSLLGLVHPGIAIADPACVAKTFPDFFQVLDTLR